MLRPLVKVNRIAYEPGKGTGSIISVNGEITCYCLELPWKDNQRNVSCIPGGVYRATIEDSKRFAGKVIRVHDVPGRSGILFHPANYLGQLLGCFAPCTRLEFWRETPDPENGNQPSHYEYVGWASRKALDRLIEAIEDGLEAGKTGFYVLVDSS